MWLAAALMSLDQQMIKIERSGGPRAIFVFLHSDSLEGTIQRYKEGKLRLEPQKLLVQMRLIKTRLYDKPD